MRPDKTLVLIMILVLASCPFLCWGILVVIARVWKHSLRAVLPWLRAIRWVAWILGMSLATAALFGPHKYFWLLPLGIALGTCTNIGLAPVQSWVKRRYAPELLQPESANGYSPSSPS
jgi:hypothetical protein